MLEYASNDLKNNYDIILAAIQNTCESLKFASDDLKNNYNIILNAILNDVYYDVILDLPLKFMKNRKLLVNINNCDHYTYYYGNIIIKIMDYKFKIKENKISENLKNIFIFF